MTVINCSGMTTMTTTAAAAFRFLMLKRPRDLLVEDGLQLEQTTDREISPFYLRVFTGNLFNKNKGYIKHIDVCVQLSMYNSWVVNIIVSTCLKMVGWGGVIKSTQMFFLWWTTLTPKKEITRSGLRTAGSAVPARPHFLLLRWIKSNFEFKWIIWIKKKE